MIDARCVTRDDIRHVVYRMWRRGAEELKCHGDFDNEAIIRELHLRSQEYGYTLFYEREPVAVFGAHAVGENEYHTWFTATNKFHFIGKEATMFLKRLVTQKTIEKPDCVLELWSAVDHPDADRWFKLLGFQLRGSQGAFTRYGYAPRKRLTTGVKSGSIETAASGVRPAEQTASAADVFLP